MTSSRFTVQMKKVDEDERKTLEYDAQVRAWFCLVSSKLPVVHCVSDFVVSLLGLQVLVLSGVSSVHRGSRFLTDLLTSKEVSYQQVYVPTLTLRVNAVFVQYFQMWNFCHSAITFPYKLFLCVLIDPSQLNCFLNRNKILFCFFNITYWVLRPAEVIFYRA